MEIFKRVPEFDFMEKKNIATALSCAVILIGIISIMIHGGLKYGIDFAGGTLVQLKFSLFIPEPIIAQLTSSKRFV